MHSNQPIYFIHPGSICSLEFEDTVRIAHVAQGIPWIRIDSSHFIR